MYVGTHTAYTCTCRYTHIHAATESPSTTELSRTCVVPTWYADVLRLLS